MSRHLSLGFFISLLFHGLGVCSIAYIGILLPDTSPPLVIDFSIEKSCTDCPPSNSQKTHATTVPEKIAEQPETLLASIPDPVEEKSFKHVEVKKQKIKKRLVSKAEVRRATVEAVPASVLDTVPDEEVESKAEQVDPVTAAISPATNHPVSIERPATVQGSAKHVQATPVSLQKQYLKAHFSYIKDAIQLKTSYPTMARKMGWEGKVLLSFVISTSGYVEAIQIIKSCGFRALDQNAIKTIQQCAPFPRPPVNAELILPITYHLN